MKDENDIIIVPAYAGFTLLTVRLQWSYYHDDPTDIPLVENQFYVNRNPIIAWRTDSDTQDWEPLTAIGGVRNRKLERGGRPRDEDELEMETWWAVLCPDGKVVAGQQAHEQYESVKEWERDVFEQAVEDAYVFTKETWRRMRADHSR